MGIGLQGQGRPHMGNHRRIQAVYLMQLVQGHKAPQRRSEFDDAPGQHRANARQVCPFFCSGPIDAQRPCRMEHGFTPRNATGFREHLAPLGSLLPSRCAASWSMVRVHVLQPATQRCHGGLRNVLQSPFPGLGPPKVAASQSHDQQTCPTPVAKLGMSDAKKRLG